MSAQRSPKFFYLILTLMIVVTSAFIAAVPAQAAGIGTWSSTGSMATARQYHSATLLSDGKVLVAGGGSSSGILASAELYDPTSSSWSSTGSMATARQYHSATLLLDGKVLVAGGVGGAFYQRRAV